jgi:hypothetical protein
MIAVKSMKRPRQIDQRIKIRLQALGYWKDGRPDVLRFCHERGYLRQYVYAWLKGRVPTVRNLMRLGADLVIPPAWLLFGDDPPGGWTGAEIRQLIRPRAPLPPGGRARPEVHARTRRNGSPRI